MSTLSIFHYKYNFSFLPFPYHIPQIETTTNNKCFPNFSRSLDISYNVLLFLNFQTDEIYWLYEINGLPPLPKSMEHVKAKIDADNKTYDSMPPIRHNFIRENAKLRSTAVSSTIKGAPLVKKHK